METAWPHVLCIAGSPRAGGNSERLLRACARGVEAAGGRADILVVAEHDITPCNACGECASGATCTIEDDMRAIYTRIDVADAVVVASPVYFATVPAVLKALYDRCQPYWVAYHLLGRPRGPKRPGAFLTVRGGGDPFGFDAAIATTRSVFAVLGVEYCEEQRVVGPDAPSDILEHPGALVRAEEIGARLVSQVCESAPS